MFKTIVWLSAIGIALCAAFFSVTGIATLFSGKFYAVMAMAVSLEVGKLVAASFLYRYWKTTGRPLKAYMSIGVIVLMLITSVGIYGYLSAAYASVAAVPQTTLNQISAIETRQATLSSNITRYQQDNTALEARRQQVQQSLDNVLAGQTNLSQRSAFANLRTEIEQLDTERRSNLASLATAQTEHDSLENVKVQLNADLNTNSKVGTFIYIARTLGMPLDTVVKYFVLIIVFVFDPLALSLILAYNSIVVKEQRQRDNEETFDLMERQAKRNTKPWSTLRDKMSPEAKERVAKKTEELLEELDDFSDGPGTYVEPEEARKKRYETLARADEAYQQVFGRAAASPKPWIDLKVPEPQPQAIEVEPEELEQIAELVEQPPEPTPELRTLMAEEKEEAPASPEAPKQPIQKGWSLAARDIPGIQYDHLPYFMRPGYDWDNRKAEWQRDPQAVGYYEEYVEPTLEG